jgi:lipase
MAPQDDYESFDVGVAGGSLRVGRWGRGPDVVLAAHGLTANHRSFAALAEVIDPRFSLVAPDLRGRGRSASVAGGCGMAVHASDLLAILDHLGIRRVTVLGHSMGAFVAAAFAASFPDRVGGVVMVDGGLPLDLGPIASMSIEEVTRAVVGPALDRLDMSFPSVDAYLDFWRGHPALGPDWNQYMEDTYRYDLVGQSPAMRSGVVKEAVLEDCASQLEPGMAETAARGLKVPVSLVWAGRGMFGEPPGLYGPAAVEEWQKQLPQLDAVAAPELNHYTILLTEPGATLVARLLAEVSRRSW